MEMGETNMKSVVITGSSSGLGLELAKEFRRAGYDVALSGRNEEKLSKAAGTLQAAPGSGKVVAIRADVTSLQDVEHLATEADRQLGGIGIWINNAGVNQPFKAIWELTEAETDAMVSTDLMGTINGSKVAMNHMLGKGGAIYNVEGYGSNDAMMLGLNLYGTTKRAVTHFTVALAKESEERGTGVLVGRLSPGIMLTDFTTNSLGGDRIDLPEKTKNFYNIVGDYPDVVARFLVDGMLKNTKNNIQIQWLTTAKVMKKFMTARKNKKDYFKEK